MEKKKKIIVIGIIGTLSITFLTLTSLGVFDLFGNEFYQYDPDSGVSGLSDALEEVHNITLEVEYVTQPTDVWANFSLYGYETTVFDALESRCSVETKVYGLGILVIGIDGVKGDWIYFVNGKFAGVAANAFNLDHGDYILWKHINV